VPIKPKNKDTKIDKIKDNKKMIKNQNNNNNINNKLNKNNNKLLKKCNLVKLKVQRKVLNKFNNC
jgi:hypothetical protein